MRDDGLKQSMVQLAVNVRRRLGFYVDIINRYLSQERIELDKGGLP